MRFLIYLTLFLSASLNAGSIHKWVDESGNVHYSDAPPVSVQTEDVRVQSAPSNPGKALPRLSTSSSDGSDENSSASNDDPTADSNDDDVPADQARVICENAREDLQVIVSETIRCREIVKSLLDFARQTVPKKRKADINEIIHRAATVVENQLSMGQVELVTDLDDKLPNVTVDANQIQQVFINLMVNAADAIGEDGGTINITSRAISLGPAGTLQIKRALCRKRHDLVDRKIQIDGKPAISMRYKKKKETGLIHLNPMYGSNAHKLNGMPDFDKEVQLMCPDCSASLIADGEFCPDCGSPIYAFEVPLKGLVQGCLKEGCGWHRWEQVDSSWNDEYVEVRVTDDGCGIPEEQLPKLFEPFSTTKGQKGTGLGLAVTWGIIDNHNGTISVKSKLGAGTTFIIRIPVGP